MASPLTNLAAPSIAPLNSASLVIILLRCFASFSSISPAFKSASTPICLPGIASSVNLAATSAILVAPLVITTKLMITRIIKTIMPTT